MVDYTRMGESDRAQKLLDLLHEQSAIDKRYLYSNEEHKELIEHVGRTQQYP